MKRILSFLKKLKRMPLVDAIVISCIVFAILIVSDGSGKYDFSSFDVSSDTVIGMGLEKVREGIWPWPVDEAIRSVTSYAASQQTAEADEEAASSYGTSEEAADAETVAAAPGAESTESSPAGSTEAAEEGGTEASPAGDTETAAEGITEEHELTEEELAQQQAEEELAKKEENPTYIHADTMPDDVNDPVVQAKDYGNAEKGYLSPDDEVYNTDTEGMFAQNGDYYRFQDVEDDYLTDALIIGNSRTEGLHGYSTIQNYAYFACKEGISVFAILDQSLNYYTPDGSQSSAKLTDILASRHFGKVYISLGINEVGVGNSKTFYNSYREVLETIREYQPDAIIFIEGMLHVSKNRSQTSSVFSNKIVVQRNTAVSTLANGHDIFYIDMNSVFCDEDGDLPNDITADGIHLYAADYEKWHAFLLTRGIIRTDADRSEADYEAAGAGE